MRTFTQHRWNDTSAEQLNPAIRRRYVNTDLGTVARFELKHGGVVASHAHPNEQASCVLSGRLRFSFEGDDTIVGRGEIVQIPGGVSHGVDVLEDSVVLDIFSPIRQDWIDGTDNCFIAGGGQARRIR